MQQTEEVLFATEQPDDYTDQIPEIQTDKYLIFSSDGLMYGIKAGQVKDIITDYTITYLPRVPDYVRGVINLRGQIIPMVDIRLRLGKPSEDNSCGIVVDVEGNMVGRCSAGRDSPRPHQPGSGHGLRYVYPSRRQYHAGAGLRPAAPGLSRVFGHLRPPKRGRGRSYSQ